MRSTHWFRVGDAPDVREHRIRMRCAGPARQAVFEGAAQLVRAVARAKPGEVSLTLRGDFDPARRLKDRLRWSLRLDVEPSIAEETVRALATNGPLAPFYVLEPTEPCAPPAGRVVAEIVRREELLTPLVSVDRNENVAVTPLYVVLHPLEPVAENDWMTLDRVLARHPHPATFELRIGAIDSAPLQRDALKLLANLRAINAFDDLDAWSAAAMMASAPSHEAGRVDAARPKRLRDPLADEVATEAQRLCDRTRKPLVAFSLRVFTSTTASARTLATAIAESAFANGAYDLVVVDASQGASHAAWIDAALDASVRAADGLDTLDLRPDEAGALRGFKLEFVARHRRLARAATVDEIASALRLPVAEELSPSTFRKSSDPLPAAAGARRIVLGLDQDVGGHAALPRGVRGVRELCEEAERTAPLVELAVDALTKHVFVCGVPGSGKTTAMFNLIAQLWSHGIPTLVLETAKTEYRVLRTMTDHPDATVRDLARSLRIYTPGNDDLLPMRFNPFEFDPTRVTRDEHIENLLACFCGGLPGIEGHIEAILTDAVERAYAERAALEDPIPTMRDLARIVPRVADEKGYAGEVGANTKALLAVRMGMLTSRNVGRIFSSRASTPSIAELLRYPTVIELEHAGPKTAPLLTLFLLSALREYIKTDPQRVPNGGLAHVILVEEAHNLVGRPRTSSGPAEGNATQEATSFVTRMLAELRALGEGIVIADQLPTAVAPDVVRQTGTKIAARLVSQDDREEIGASMLLDEDQTHELARLVPGEAFVHGDGFHIPRRTLSLDAADYLGLRGRYPTNPQLLDLVGATPWAASVLEADARALRERDEACRAQLLRARSWVDSVAMDGLKRVDENLTNQPEQAADALELVGLVDEIEADLTAPLVEASKEFDAIQAQQQRMEEVAARRGVELPPLAWPDDLVALYMASIEPWLDRLQARKKAASFRGT